MKARASRRELAWLDASKAVALLWIVASHVAEPLLGSPAAGNPDKFWPDFGARVAQFAPIGHGLLGPLADAFRYVGWTGDNGVSMFLIASGFGLTFGLLRRGAPAGVSPLGLYRRRAERIYPLWWTAHLVVAVLALAAGKLLFTNPHFVESFVGIRFTIPTMYFISPSWWYVGLLLQLYIVFPLLYSLLARFGALRFLIGCALVGFAARGIGLFTLVDYLDAWSRGAVFVTRLPDFAFGMAFAWWYERRRADIDRIVSPLGAGVCAAVALAGFALSFSRGGMIVAQVMTGAGIFALVFIAAQLRDARVPNWLLWIGEHSYSIYLTHQIFTEALLPHAGATPLRRIGITALALGLGLASALGLERLGDALGANLRRLGWRRASAFGALGLAGIGAALLFANTLVTRFDPQEVYGWGERVSVQRDSEVGWKLVPSQTVRLRWVSYDYAVTSNSLGFPAPEPPAPSVRAYRVMTTGDAFTSAEGVDTALAWPRLLERELAPGGIGGLPVRVANFAITGYGPNQEAAVVRDYAPRVRPNAIVLEMFTNDYEDVLLSDDDFASLRGDGLPPPGGLSAALHLAQLRAFVRHELKDPIAAKLHLRPNVEGLGFADAVAFDPARPGRERSATLTRERLRQMRDVARSLHARFVVILVPSPVQVCASRDLRYDDPPVALVDPELPQRVTRTLTTELGIEYYDARAALRASPVCPYQPRNLHFTRAGHETFARYVAGILGRAP